MSENLRQSLSALMDNEADEFEVRRCLQQMDEDGAAVWSRYQLAGAVIRGEQPDARVDLSEGVMAQLNAEPVYQRSQHEGLWKRVASVAVAASMTAAVILGVQNFSGDQVETAPQLASSQSERLIMPAPSSSNIMPAQYGRSNDLAMPDTRPNADVIRLSYGMEYYLNQHHSMMRSKRKSWTASWMPDGFSPVRHEVMPDSEVMIYSDGRSAVSISVEPFGKHKSAPGAVQYGNTVALGKQVGDQFVTVVGPLPLMIADRIATSVDRAVQ